MTSKTPSAIGIMFHRFRNDIPSFEVTTFSSYYDLVRSITQALKLEARVIR